MKNTLLFVLATGKICSGAWLALLLLAWSSLSTLPAAAQSNSAAYTWTTLAGYPGEGSADGVGTAALFFNPQDVAVDGAGNVYVADSGNNTIRKITPAGMVSTIAGFPAVKGSTDGIGAAARFYDPRGVAVDSATNLYIADGYNYTIRKITPVGTNWVVTTIAGLAQGGGTTDGTNSAARFGLPAGIAVDSATNLYVADFGLSTIRKITPVGTNWVVTTIAGLAGTNNFANGTNSTAWFNHPAGIAVDSATNLYVADFYNDTIRKITPVGTNWVVTTIAGLAGANGSANGTNSGARFFWPSGIAVDSATNLYVADSYNDTIRKITPVGTNWVVSTFAGKPGWVWPYVSKDGTGTNAAFGYPEGIAFDLMGNLYVADAGSSLIREITSAGVVSTLAGPLGSAGSSDGTGSAARFSGPQGIMVDSTGNSYVADGGTIRRITSAGLVSTIAGQPGVPGAETNGPGNYATFYEDAGVVRDGAGNIYVADACTIRKITPAGMVSTIAGTYGVYNSGDGTNSTAQFNGCAGIAMDSATNLYVADRLNSTIRKITPVGTNWVVTTIAGLAGTNGVADGTNSVARFHYPTGVAVDSATNLYVADSVNLTIREITPVGTNWVVTTIAGSAGAYGFADGVGTNARFVSPYGIAVDSTGEIYVTDASTLIRKITPIGTNWVVNTIGGSFAVSGSADGAGSAALFNYPEGIAVDSAGNVYVADTHNNTIRKGVFTAYGGANPIAYSPPAMNSSLTVTLLPPEANGQWRFPWEIAWHNSGDTVSNLVAGNYPVEFRNVPGWLAIPPSLTGNNAVPVPANSSVSITNQYYATISAVDTNSGGTLTVTLGPNPPNGAFWGFLGTPPSFPSGYSTNLAAGTYLITFATVSNRVTPPNLSVQVQAGLTTYLAENYLLAQSAPGGVLLPAPVSSTNISDLTDYPFGFNGQLESDVGYGSGVAVQTNVVLTAAHLVFNDQTLSYVSQVYWYFQRETGVFQPEPQAARGWYVLSGYAEQRTNDLEVYAPDTSTPQSRNLDVAALYFLSPVAGGGYGGYLPSDGSPNPWLTSTAEKMLVGYPVDGSQFGDATIVPGEMYQIGPQPYPLTLATDPVTGQQEVYTASWFLGYPGNSGGPLYVQYNGYYYPAGVYLGTLYSGVTPYASAVRAIDSAVVNLITNAATLGDTGTNNTGGGVITIIPNQALSATNEGYVQFQLAPPAAVLAGAAWRLSGLSGLDLANLHYYTNFQTASYMVAVATTNGFTVQFKPLAGWNLPPTQTVTVLPYPPIVTNIGFYTVTNPVLVAGKSVGLGITGTTGTVYRLERRTSLTSGSWLPVSTNTILTNGFNLLLPKPATNGNTFFYRAVWLGQ